MLAQRGTVGAPGGDEPAHEHVRVRTAGIVAGILAAIAAVSWALSWAGGLTPLTPYASSSAPYGLKLLARPPVDGESLYRWQSGGRYVVTLALHNSASVPVTITGVDHTFSDWVGASSGPTLQNSTGNLRLLPGPFHAVRVPGDGVRAIAIVFHANPKSRCSGTYTTDSVTLHFTALGAFHDTETIALGDEALALTRRC
jgi:hypothetical protein